MDGVEPVLYVANFTLSYVIDIFKGAFAGLARISTSAAESGESQTMRVPFSSAAGDENGPPLYQRLLAFASVGFTVACIPFGLWEVWRRHRTRALLVTMALGAALQPFMYVLRLTNTSAGWEISNRSGEFVFLGIAPIVALAVFNLKFPPWLTIVKRVIVAPAVTVMLLGGMIVSTAPWTLMPWPYQAGSDQRSIELEGIRAAEWSAQYLGPGNRIVSDRVNTLLWGTYGRQFAAGGEGGDDAAFVLPGIVMTSKFDDYARGETIKAKVQYIVTDMRFSRYSPLFGYLFFENEKDIFTNVVYPLPRASLEKYDAVRDAQRVFDSGSIVVYDMRRITNGQ